jgi:hypothetical protein
MITGATTSDMVAQDSRMIADVTIPDMAAQHIRQKSPEQVGSSTASTERKDLAVEGAEQLTHGVRQIFPLKVSIQKHIMHWSNQQYLPENIKHLKSFLLPAWSMAPSVGLA